MAWNPLQSKKSVLTSKPVLTQGIVSHEDERKLELSFVNLQDMEDHCKKLYKEVKKYEDCIQAMHKLEHSMSSDLFNSPVCKEDGNLRQIAENYQSVVYQMSHKTDDLMQLSQKTVVEPMKKLTGEFSGIAAALRKRDMALSECMKVQNKYEKTAKLEKTGNNVVKTEQAKKVYIAAKEEFESQNRALLLELPQFYEKRTAYFNPCLQALIRSQVDYYGETTRLFTHLVAQHPDCRLIKEDDQFNKELEQQLTEIKALSIVGS